MENQTLYDKAMRDFEYIQTCGFIIGKIVRDYKKQKAEIEAKQTRENKECYDKYVNEVVESYNRWNANKK